MKQAVAAGGDGGQVGAAVLVQAAAVAVGIVLVGLSGSVIAVRAQAVDQVVSKLLIAYGGVVAVGDNAAGGIVGNDAGI